MEEENKGGKLPPGFRFHPTDEELISHYLKNKTSNPSFTGRAIADVDLNRSEPWDLPGKAKMGEKEWYFFSVRDRKYPTGIRTNRATSTGYWKTTGKDKEIFSSTTSELVGMKKTLVFYKGRAPRGEKTNWVIHEYRSHSAKSTFHNSKDEWVVCRVFQKSGSAKKYSSNHTRMGIPSNADPFASASVVPSTIHHQNDPYHMGNADFAELTRVIRGGGGNINHSPVMTNHVPVPVPFAPVHAQHHHQHNFTVSGVNLNLGGVQRAPMSAPFAIQQHLAGDGPPLASAMDVVGLCASSFANAAHEMNQGHARHGRHQAMQSYMDQLDGYRPAY